MPGSHLTKPTSEYPDLFVDPCGSSYVKMWPLMSIVHPRLYWHAGCPNTRIYTGTQNVAILCSSHPTHQHSPFTCYNHILLDCEQYYDGLDGGFEERVGVSHKNKFFMSYIMDHNRYHTKKSTLQTPKSYIQLSLS